MALPVRRLIKPLVVVGLLLAVGLIYWRWGDWLTLDFLASKEAEIRSWGREHPVLAPLLAFGIYTVATGLSLPGAAVLSLVVAWYFGFPIALVLVSFASTLGATIAFLLSRYLLRERIESRYGERMSTLNERLRREGAFYLFTLRLLPVVPFFLLNLAMGLTAMRTRTYWWVSQLGMLPGTAVYVYAGSAVPNLHELARDGVGGILTPRLLIAFVLLGLFPLVTKKLLDRFRRFEDVSEELN